MKPTGPTNPLLEKLILQLKIHASQHKSDTYKKIAYELSKPTRRRNEVDIFKLSKFTNKNETLVVPGKVLSKGRLPTKLKVAAWKFSKSALQSCTPVSFEQLMKENPQGKNLRIII